MWLLAPLKQGCVDNGLAKLASPVIFGMACEKSLYHILRWAQVEEAKKQGTISWAEDFLFGILDLTLPQAPFFF